MSERDLYGDDLALELAGHLEFVRRMARALVRDDHVAEDVVQETMMAAIAHRPNPSLGLRAWLSSVLRRRVLLHFRTEQRRVARETLLVRDAGGASEQAVSDAEQALQSIERTTAVGRSVANLPDPYRTVVVMRFFDGLNPQAIAERLDRPVNTVNTQIQRGLERLRGLLDESAGGDRRAWVMALLPHALHGRRGWWPASVGGLGGVSYGVLAQFAVLLLGLVMGAAWMGWLNPEEAPGERIAATPELEEVPGVRPSAPAVADLETPAERTALDVREIDAAAVSSAAASSEEPERFELTVRDASGPVEGATVTAVARAAGGADFASPYSEVKGPDGLILAVHSYMKARSALEDPSGQPIAEPSLVRTQTDANGVARLPILDDQSWVVHVNFDGAATEHILLNASKPFPRQQSIQLEPAARLVVDRGSFPIDSSILVELRCQANGYLRHQTLEPGRQELEFMGLQAAEWKLEALSGDADEVGHWRRSIKLDEGLVARLDLSQGGVGHTLVQITGGVAAAPPQFIEVQSRAILDGRPEWNYLAPVFDGEAHFHGLPPGPIVVRVLWGITEIAKVIREADRGGDFQRLGIEIPKGVIEVLHRGRDASKIQWRLLRSAGDLGSEGEWTEVGGAVPGDGATRFVGCAPGAHRLWMFEPGTVRRFDVEVQEAASTVDSGGPSVAVGRVSVTRGAGIKPGAPVEVEVSPGLWQPVELRGGELLLTHGVHRLRCALVGLGHAVREVDVPADVSASFEESGARREVSVFSPGVEQETWLTVEFFYPDGEGRAEQAQRLKLEADGSGTLRIRSGRYLLMDRSGRSATVDITDDTTALEFTLR